MSEGHRGFIGRVLQRFLALVTPREALFFGLGMACAGMLTWDTLDGPWLVGYGAVVAFLYTVLYVQTKRKE